jgi:sigma-B regulation protein RsbU (phosphoserine phosphatase)
MTFAGKNWVDGKWGKVMSDEPSSLLIVDDEELNREGLARRLRRHGYAVTLAQSGREAIELLGEHRFDLVLLDIMMPGMTGMEVLKFLRRIDSLINLPIIMVTAKGESQDMVEALELGANDYVTKPLDLPVVLARIRTQLALKRAVSQVTELEQQLAARNKELEAAGADRKEAAAELEAFNQRRKGDLEAVARVQRALLAAASPEVSGARFGWALEPCGPLAGDFLNIFPLSDRRLGLCVVDVNGQGVAGALLSAGVSHLLARLASPPRDSGPAQVAGQLSKQLAAGGGAGIPFTLLYGVLGLDEREFRFISAGHPGPVHLRADAPPVVLPGAGFPVGIGPANYQEQVVKLQLGDRLVLYSDGVTEAPNPDGEHFGARRLLAALEQTRRLPLQDGLQALLREFEGWRGDTPRQDDIAVLAAEIAAPMTP